MNDSVANPGNASQMALVARLAPIVGLVLPGAGLLALVFIYYSAEHPLVRQHALSELISNLIALLIVSVGLTFTMVTFGLGALIVVPMLLLMSVVGLPFWCFAIAAASRGETYEYPWLRVLGMGE